MACPVQSIADSSGCEKVEVVICEDTYIPVDQLQRQLTTVLKNYDAIKYKIDQMISTCIPNLIVSLDGAKLKWSDCLQLSTALSVAFAPVTTSLTLAGSCVAIGTYLADLWVQSSSQNLQKHLKIQCESAWLAYKIFLKSFDELCDMLSDTNLGYSGVENQFIQHKSTAGDTSYLPYNVELINSVTTFLAKETEDAGGLGYQEVVLATLKKAGAFVGRISTMASVVGIVCSGYIFLDTVTLIFGSCNCAAAKDIDTYIIKLDKFQKDLLHIIDKMRLGIQILKSEVARIEDKQEMYLLEQQLERQKKSFITKMEMQRKFFDHNLKSQEEQYKRQMKAFKKEFKNQLKMQRNQYEERLYHQLEIQKTLQEEQKFQFQSILKDQEALVQKVLQQK